MKKLYSLLPFLLALLLGAAPAQAQAQPSTNPLDSLRQQLTYVFANVDKSQVPTQYLEDYGVRLLPLRYFNGTLSDTCLLRLPLWRQLYATLFSSHVQEASPLPPLSDLNAALAAQAAASAAIPVLVQRLDYAALRPDALSQNLLSVQNGQLFDVPGRSQSPYLLRTLFAASPGASVSPTGEVAFIFSRSLHVQSGGGALRTISVDFGDGRGYVLATWDRPLAASYCSAGTKRIKVRVAYTAGSPAAARRGQAAKAAPSTVSYESQFDLQVLTAECATSRYVYKGRRIVFPASSAHSGGSAYIRYGGTAVADTVLDQPLIVAEGYDVSHAAPALQSNYTIDNFLLNIRSTNGYDLQGNLDNANYDIVFLDYNNGTDDIRRNAALFEEVVRWVNANKVARNGALKQNVVLGISMGGLVARYGLAEMVKNPQLANNNPDTRLLITHDSPHHGANTPLGIQALTRQANATLTALTIRGIVSPTWHFITGNDILPELFQAEQLLDEPATKQLLLLRATRSGLSYYASYGTEANSFIEGDYRTMITPAQGQSFPYQFIATSLGSQCGQELFAPYSELLRVDGDGFFTVLPYIATLGIHTQIIANALPAPGQTGRIAGLRIWIDAKVLSFIPLPRFYLSHADFYSPANNPVALDGLPGGTQPIAGQGGIYPGSYPGNLFGLNILYGNVDIAMREEFCFVPTASALDVPYFTTSSAHASYINGIVAPGNQPQPLDFIGQERYTVYPASGPSRQKYNYPHPFFPARQAQWLYNELEGLDNAPTCSAECSPAVATGITGANTTCNLTTYTAALQASGYTYTWTATPSSVFTVTSGTGPTFQTANIGTTGTGTIQLTINTSRLAANKGCTTVFTKLVSIGAPFEPRTTGPNWGPNCGSVPIVCTIENYDPTLTYSLSVSGSLATNGGVQSDGTYRVRSTQAGGSGSISLTATASGCGSSTTTLNVTTPNCSGGGRGAYAAYPNPAADQVTIAPAEADARAGAPAGSTPVVLTVLIADSFGRLWLQQQGSGPALGLATAGLPVGLYLVTVLQNGVLADHLPLAITR